MNQTLIQPSIFYPKSLFCIFISPSLQDTFNIQWINCMNMYQQTHFFFLAAEFRPSHNRIHFSSLKRSLLYMYVYRLRAACIHITGTLVSYVNRAAQAVNRITDKSKDFKVSQAHCDWLRGITEVGKNGQREWEWQKPRSKRLWRACK